MFGLSVEEMENIKLVFQQNTAVESVVLYGSRAKGNFKAGSDIDITLIGNTLCYKNLVNISLELDDLLLPYEFDISIYKDITSESLLEHIKRIGVVLYERA